MVDASQTYTQAFAQVSKYGVSTYAHLLQFIAVVVLFSASSFCITHFMSERAKASDAFLMQMSTRLVKLLCGISLCLIFLKY